MLMEVAEDYCATTGPSAEIIHPARRGIGSIHRALVSPISLDREYWCRGGQGTRAASASTFRILMRIAMFSGSRFGLWQTLRFSRMAS
jgi:hypothetical protein